MQLFETLIFPILFTTCVAIAMFLAASAKAQAKPWIFLGAALLAIFGGWVITYLESLRATGAPGPAPALSNMAQLISLTCSAFAGALASVAITNRAKFEHDRETSGLEEAYRQAREMEKFNADKLGTIRKDLQIAHASTDPAAKYLVQMRYDQVEERHHECAERVKRLAEKAKALGLKVE